MARRRYPEYAAAALGIDPVTGKKLSVRDPDAIKRLMPGQFYASGPAGEMSGAVRPGARIPTVRFADRPAAGAVTAAPAPVAPAYPGRPAVSGTPGIPTFSAVRNYVGSLSDANSQLLSRALQGDRAMSPQRREGVLAGYREAQASDAATGAAARESAAGTLAHGRQLELTRAQHVEPAAITAEAGKEKERIGGEAKLDVAQEETAQSRLEAASREKIARRRESNLERVELLKAALEQQRIDKMLTPEQEKDLKSLEVQGGLLKGIYAALASDSTSTTTREGLEALRPAIEASLGIGAEKTPRGGAEPPAEEAELAPRTPEEKVLYQGLKSLEASLAEDGLNTDAERMELTGLQSWYYDRGGKDTPFAAKAERLLKKYGFSRK